VSEIARAAEILRNGGLVAFPTETVYGLGADATNSAAVTRIFQAKGRPSTNPLICHVADVSVARRYARDWPLAASRIANRFWPGPLTLVVPKTRDIPDEVTAGLDSVGLRAPDHPLTLELLRTFGKPLAGPSANRSSHISPTTAQHVQEDLGEHVDLILDGGPCRVGIESTVLDLTGEVPVIRRPGGISLEKIEAVIGPVQKSTDILAPNVAAKSPGEHEKHYAPQTDAIRFETARPAVTPAGSDGVISIGSSDQVQWQGESVSMPNSPNLYAKHLYAVLREMDRKNLTRIYIQMPPDEPQWAAVRDRLMRATRPLSR
jgi:L-threonylcarbamoyladenylate synthase